jgi:hypothetical protein
MFVGSEDWIWVANNFAYLLGPKIKFKLPMVKFVHHSIVWVFLITIASLKIETHLLNHIVALALIAEIFFKMAQNIPIINLNPFACVIERLEKWTQITPRANISFSKDRQSIPPISLYGTHKSKNITILLCL